MEPVTIGILAAAAISAAAKIYADSKKKDAAPAPAGDTYSDLKNMYDSQEASPLAAASGQVAGQVQPAPVATPAPVQPMTAAAPTTAPVGVGPTNEDPLERLRQMQKPGF